MQHPTNDNTYGDKTEQHVNYSEFIQRDNTDKPLAHFNVLYLGTALSSPGQHGIDAIQEPLSRQYPINGKNGVRGIEAWLTIYENGLQLQFARDSSVVLFYPILSLIHCASIRFATRTETGGKFPHGWHFVPLDSPAAARIENKRNPPLFAVTLSRTRHSPANECHCFVTKKKQTALALAEACFKAYYATKIPQDCTKIPLYFKIDDNGLRNKETENEIKIVSARDEEKPVDYQTDIQKAGFFYKTNRISIKFWQLSEHQKHDINRQTLSRARSNSSSESDSVPSSSLRQFTNQQSANALSKKPPIAPTSVKDKKSGQNSRVQWVSNLDTKQQSQPTKNSNTEFNVESPAEKELLNKVKRVTIDDKLYSYRKQKEAQKEKYRKSRFDNASLGTTEYFFNEVVPASILRETPSFLQQQQQQQPIPNFHVPPSMQQQQHFPISEYSAPPSMQQPQQQLPISNFPISPSMQLQQQKQQLPMADFQTSPSVQQQPQQQYPISNFSVPSSMQLQQQRQQLPMADFQTSPSIQQQPQQQYPISNFSVPSSMQQQQQQQQPTPDFHIQPSIQQPLQKQLSIANFSVPPSMQQQQQQQQQPLQKQLSTENFPAPPSMHYQPLQKQLSTANFSAPPSMHYQPLQKQLSTANFSAPPSMHYQPLQKQLSTANFSAPPSMQQPLQKQPSTANFPTPPLMQFQPLQKQLSTANFPAPLPMQQPLQEQFSIANFSSLPSMQQQPIPNFHVPPSIQQPLQTQFSTANFPAPPPPPMQQQPIPDFHIQPSMQQPLQKQFSLANFPTPPPMQQQPQFPISNFPALPSMQPQQQPQFPISNFPALPSMQPQQQQQDPISYFSAPPYNPQQTYFMPQFSAAPSFTNTNSMFWYYSM